MSLSLRLANALMRFNFGPSVGSVCVFAGHSFRRIGRAGRHCSQQNPLTYPMLRVSFCVLV